jgi:hypothetical protein
VHYHRTNDLEIFCTIYNGIHHNLKLLEFDGMVLTRVTGNGMYVAMFLKFRVLAAGNFTKIFYPLTIKLPTFGYVACYFTDSIEIVLFISNINFMYIRTT